MPRATLRRIRPLFRPYRGRLFAVVALIVTSASLGMISPFLLRDVLDQAIPERDTALLTGLVAGMIGIAIATQVLGVGQTWLSNLVGQRVMHDLRTRVYRHLQRLSLAFFTRTRTGEVQSRIANDIGGVETVVTSTATSIASNLTTVIATVVAMFLLDWRLAVFALILLPFFVLLTKRVGAQRRRIAAERRSCMTRWPTRLLSHVWPTPSTPVATEIATIAPTSHASSVVNATSVPIEMAAPPRSMPAAQ